MIFRSFAKRSQGSVSISLITRFLCLFRRKYPSENAGKGISQCLGFKIFWGSMPPHPPRVLRLWRSSPQTSTFPIQPSCYSKTYRIYSCISRPFTIKKSAKKIALDLYTCHTQRPEQGVREISITTAWSALGKPVIIVVDFHQFSEHSSPTKKCEIINVKWFKRRFTGDYFYCVFWSV